MVESIHTKRMIDGGERKQQELNLPISSLCEKKSEAC